MGSLIHIIKSDEELLCYFNDEELSKGKHDRHYSRVELVNVINTIRPEKIKEIKRMV